MIQKQIELVRQQLHDLLSGNASYNSIYKKSVELDKLISQFYKLKNTAA